LFVQIPIRILLILSVTLDANKKFIFCLFLFVTLFCKDKKSEKKSRNSRNQGFSYYFCRMIGGSEAGSGSVPLTNGSRSERPKNLRILRIRNTVEFFSIAGAGESMRECLPRGPRRWTGITPGKLLQGKRKTEHQYPRTL